MLQPARGGERRANELVMLRGDGVEALRDKGDGGPRAFLAGGAEEEVSAPRDGFEELDGVGVEGWRCIGRNEVELRAEDAMERRKV